MATKQTKATGQNIPPTGENKEQTVFIKPPRFGRAVFSIRAAEDTPLVIHRFSAKLKEEMRAKMEEGKSAGSKRNREPKDMDKAYNDARYVHADGWDGFNASGIRHGMISACRLVNFKMVLAKLSIFVEADGRDATEPQIPLVRIYGKPIRQDDMARVSTGEPYITTRPAYHGWAAKVRIRWDKDQFSLQDVTNLLMRVGMQGGIGEGRPDSKNSPGMGWGLFEIVDSVEAG
jgi:hypothetical protein